MRGEERRGKEGRGEEKEANTPSHAPQDSERMLVPRETHEIAAPLQELGTPGKRVHVPTGHHRGKKRPGYWAPREASPLDQVRAAPTGASLVVSVKTLPQFALPLHPRRPLPVRQLLRPHATENHGVL